MMRLDKLHCNNTHTCRAENTGDSVFLNFEKPDSSKLLPPTARIVSYLSSAQQDLTGEPQENIRKLIIAIRSILSTIILCHIAVVLSILENVRGVFVRPKIRWAACQGRIYTKNY